MNVFLLPKIPFAGVCPTEMIKVTETLAKKHAKMYVSGMTTEALFAIVEIWKLNKSLSRRV